LFRLERIVDREIDGMSKFLGKARKQWMAKRRLRRRLNGTIHAIS